MHFTRSTGRSAFTLVELMIVVAIIGILAAIAIPKYSQLVAKSKEGHTKDNIGHIRSALSIYYSDNEGVYPTSINSLATSQKYMSDIPKTQLPGTDNSPGHDDTNAMSNVFDDTAGWYYDGNQGASWGAVHVNCTHKDYSGDLWTAY